MIVAPVNADLTEVAFTIQATNSQGSATYEVMTSSLQYDPTEQHWWWDMSGSFDLVDSGTFQTIASINGLSMSFIADPQISFGFSVQAGAFDTTFSIGSGLLSFLTIDPAIGLASGGLLLTDTNNNTASLTGLHAGGGAYVAQYNGQAPGGSTFAELFTSPLTTTVNGTNSINQEFPGGGIYSAIGVPVTDISAQFSFLLSAGDIASGSSNFEVIPTPSGFLVLVGGLLAGRKRRRRLG
ncbi:MAG: hypothetical protein O7G85_00715 [Planctomycetota bacterium]|nr:hypothetical protein [Planctomycetota bacterium]